MVDLNHGNLCISRYPYGTTENVKVKTDNRKYYVDIVKDCFKTNVQCYWNDDHELDEANKRDEGSEMRMVNVKNNAILKKDFFDSIAKIEDAQEVYEKYKRILA